MSEPFHPPGSPMLHYYGDVVRKLFLAAGLVILFAVLRDREYLNFYLHVGVLVVLALTMLAGLTNPRIRAVIVADMSVSTVLFLLFEYLAVSAYLDELNFFSEVFIVRQVLALIFMCAVYFSTKTYRGMFMRS